MGFGTPVSSPEEAVNILVQREVPEIQEVLSGKSHDAIFMPDTFLYRELTDKVTLATDATRVKTLNFSLVYSLSIC